MPEIGLALSGGGAAGFGHVAVLEALDELGLRPSAIAGTSIGALIGAGYAAGMSGADIRAHILSVVDNPMRAARTFWASHRALKAEFFSPIPPRAAVDTVLPEGVPDLIEVLETPLTVVATDFKARKAVEFREGNLRDRVAASVAIPAVFSPMEMLGTYFVDGGVVNNLPYDLLPEDMVRVAVDVASEPPELWETAPGPTDLAYGAMRIMMHNMLERKLALHPPEILLRPASNTFGVFDVLRADEIFAAAEPIKEEAKRKLDAYISAV